MIDESININIIVIDNEYRFSMMDAKDGLIVNKTIEYKTKIKACVIESICTYLDENLKEVINDK